MSVINSRLHKPAQHHVLVESPVKVLCNVNSVLQRVLQRLQHSVKHSLVLHCDELPFFLIDEGTIETVFLEVIQLIADQKNAASKIYLHIKSEPANCTVLKHSLSPNLSCLIIQFHTNIMQCTEWVTNTEQKISDLAVLLAPYGGSVTVDQLKNSGCMISAILPGKL